MLTLFHENHYYEALDNNILLVPDTLMIIAILFLVPRATNNLCRVCLTQDSAGLTSCTTRLFYHFLLLALKTIKSKYI